MTCLRFNRTADPEESIPEGPRVTVTFFDGPKPVTTSEIVPDGPAFMTVPWQDNITPEIWDTNFADHVYRSPWD